MFVFKHGWLFCAKSQSQSTSSRTTSPRPGFADMSKKSCLKDFHFLIPDLILVIFVFEPLLYMKYIV